MTRRHAPATERNREPIAAVLRDVLPHNAHVLEIGSGTGQHARFFAETLSSVTWQPSDADPAALASIAAWCGDEPRIAAPIVLELGPQGQPWPAGPFDAVVAINVIHISPWSTTEALCAGASAVLHPGAVLFLYGPYRRNGAHTAVSNAQFDASLRARDPEWGVRDLEAVEALATDAGFVLENVVAMPANNVSLVFRRE